MSNKYNIVYFIYTIFFLKLEESFIHKQKNKNKRLVSLLLRNLYNSSTLTVPHNTVIIKAVDSYTFTLCCAIQVDLCMMKEN